MNFRTLLSVSFTMIALLACQTNEQLPLEPSGLESYLDAELKPFYHSVASGDPTNHSVIIWTRVTPLHHHEITVDWEVATDSLFYEIRQTGTLKTDSTRDYTVKVDVEGLSPDTRYYYRFSALNASSPIGRTKTLKVENRGTVKLGVVSCSNYEWGFFSAYRHLAKKHVDAVIHLGDYIYEYGQGTYGDTTIGRLNHPPFEILSLSDYRTRYSLYRLDKDLQLIHQLHPFITVWDDHEITNNSHMTGAQNHQPDEGNYETRKAIARQVYYEWLPIRDNDRKEHYRSFNCGPLADFIMLDERLAGRTEQAEKVEDVDSTYSMLGKKQLDWFKSQLKQSKAVWKVIGNQVIFSMLDVAPLRPNAPQNLDAWDGYAIERDDILRHIKHNDIKNVVFVTGDTHASWAFEVPESMDIYRKTQLGLSVEFGTPSISSANWNETSSDEEVRGAEKILQTANPHLKFVNARDHGYLLLTLSSDEAKAEWFYVDNLRVENAEESLGKSITVRRNETTLSL